MADTQQNSVPIGQSKSSEASVAFAGEVPDPFVPEENQDDELTTCYKVRCRWVLDDNILAAKVCGRPNEGPGFELVRVHRPTATLVVDWTATRKGDRPQLPKPYIVLDNNLVLMKQSPIELHHIDIEGDDKALLTASGSYYYVARDRNRITLSYPKPPYIEMEDESSDAFVVDYTDFEGDITDFGWPNPYKARQAITQP